jgi:hypothetical protein
MLAGSPYGVLTSLYELHAFPRLPLPSYLPTRSSLVLQDTAVQRIVHYLENNSARENDLYFSDKISFTKAVLVGTLHGDEDLTVSVFKLLHQQISFEVGVARLAADATVVPTHAVRSSDAQYSVILLHLS